MVENNTVELKVVGERTLHCNGCENTVKMSLGLLPGLEAIEAEHDTQRISFDYDPSQIDIQQVKNQLELMGYEVELA